MWRGPQTRPGPYFQGRDFTRLIVDGPNRVALSWAGIEIHTMIWQHMLKVGSATSVENWAWRGESFGSPTDHRLDSCYNHFRWCSE